MKVLKNCKRYKNVGKIEKSAQIQKVVTQGRTLGCDRQEEQTVLTNGEGNTSGINTHRSRQDTVITTTDNYRAEHTLCEYRENKTESRGSS